MAHTKKSTLFLRPWQFVSQKKSHPPNQTLFCPGWEEPGCFGKKATRVRSHSFKLTESQAAAETGESIVIQITLYLLKETNQSKNLTGKETQTVQRELSFHALTDWSNKNSSVDQRPRKFISHHHPIPSFALFRTQHSHSPPKNFYF